MDPAGRGGVLPVSPGRIIRSQNRARIPLRPFAPLDLSDVAAPYSAS
jgi:hypothetical protein